MVRCLSVAATCSDLHDHVDLPILLDFTHRQTACDTVSLLILEEKYKASACKLGVIPEFIRLLRLPVTGEVTCAVARTLISLVHGSLENRKEFRKCLGIRPVVRLLAAGPEKEVTVASSKLIALLATERENKVESQVVSFHVSPEGNDKPDHYIYNTMHPHTVA